jgi:hypothetical protein
VVSFIRSSLYLLKNFPFYPLNRKLCGGPRICLYASSLPLSLLPLGILEKIYKSLPLSRIKFRYSGVMLSLTVTILTELLSLFTHPIHCCENLKFNIVEHARIFFLSESCFLHVRKHPQTIWTLLLTVCQLSATYRSRHTVGVENDLM